MYAGIDKAEKLIRISLSHHGITLENFHELLAVNDGACWNCDFKPDESMGLRALHIDHDHKCCHRQRSGRNNPRGARSCGKCIRGLLCRQCNLMIAGYENCPGTIFIPELEKWCSRGYFEFSAPVYSEWIKPKDFYSNPLRCRE